MSQELSRWLVLLDFVVFLAFSILFLVIGRAILELRQSGWFTGGLRGFFAPRVVADLSAVIVIFVLPFAYSGWVVWRECEGAEFILITTAVVMFQMGIALKAYADLAFSSSRPAGGQAANGET